MNEALTEPLPAPGEEKAEATAPVRIRGSLHSRLKHLADTTGGKIGKMAEKAIEEKYFSKPNVVPFTQSPQL